MTLYKTLDNGIKIFEYADAYAASLADMWNKSHDNWGGDSEVLTERIMIEEHAASLDINTYLAIDGDEVIGYCGLAKFLYDPEALYIRLLNVRPDYMGKGIGKAMVLLCVERTIELGNPRLDIYTWSGNTEAVPLYKKCGYLWEDRPTSTHLVNFIPTVLATPCFKDFFASADWYHDSTRNIDIKPDGVKFNKFEVFGYSWEKDGRKLAVGFERSGRRIRFIETDDYIIEMMADSHELSFGMEHGASFAITNKSGKPLDIAIKGRGEANISADFDFKANVTDTTRFDTKFFVGAVGQPQDQWRLHPCLLADVAINGEVVTFGLGINSKFPVWATLSREIKLPRTGVLSDCYINLTSALAQGCKISFTLPQNDYIAFEENSHAVEIAPFGTASIKLRAKNLKGGHIALPLLCKIECEGREILEFETLLHIINQDLSSCFAYEDDGTHNLICGPWRLLFAKRSMPIRYLSKNDGMIEHITYGWCGGMEFNPPRLGKPYSDEFDHITPDVFCFNDNGVMKMYTTFVSQKFPGLEVTQHFSLAPTGIFTRHYSIKNNSDKTRDFMLKDNTELPLGRNTHFGYSHEITNNADGLCFALDSLDRDKFTTAGGENWIFEDHRITPTIGIMWDKNYTPAIDWSSYIYFEHEVTGLAAGKTFETVPYEFAFGVFRNYAEYRDYVLQVSNSETISAEPNIDVQINGHNPFIAQNTAELDVSLVNRRNCELSGKFILDASNIFTSGIEQAFVEDEICESLNVSAVVGDIPQNRIGLVQSKLALANVNRDYERALFFIGGEVTKRLDGSIYAIDNGAICFKANTDFADTLFSLVSKETRQDWLLSNYPEKGPYAWWNPFIGGLNSRPKGASTAAQEKEERKADFVDISDNFGNTWSGIALTTHYNELEGHKGVTWVSYYLTLPGLPVLCSFIRFVNNTGHHKEVSIDAAIYPRDIIGVKCRCINGKDHDLRIAGESFSVRFDRFLRLEQESGEFLHLASQYKPGDAEIDNDNKIFMSHFTGKLSAANGEDVVSSPVFYVLSKDELSRESLTDLARIRF